MYGVTKPVEFEFYAYFDLGSGSWQASRYDIAGAWVDDIGEASPGITGISSPGTQLTTGDRLASCLIGDPLEIVGDGALVGLASSGATIYVWDVANDVTYEYDVPAAGYEAMAPIVLGGKLYWWEWLPEVPGPASTVEFILRSADFNLDNVTEVGTYTFPGTFSAGPWLPVQSAMNATKAKLLAGGYSVTMVLSSAATAQALTPGSPDSQPIRGLPDSAGTTAIGPAATPLRVRSMPIDTDSLFPSSLRWPMVSTAGNQWHMKTARSFGLSADRTIGLLYGTHTPSAGPDVSRALSALSTATGGDPLISVTIQDHPTLGAPTVLFLKV